jgi:hypothetical protein
MENHAKVTFTVMTGGTVTAGTLLRIDCAVSKSGTTSVNIVNPFEGNVFYKQTTTTTPVRTAVTSSTSIHYIPIATAGTHAVYTFTVDANKLADGYPYVSVVAKGASAASADIAGTFHCWGGRYQQEAPADALA